MTQIKVLPETLSNKIAAGEVVERPASVVKELLENSLDAGATRILIDIEKGGHSLIQIIDNGSGMSADDALLSVERHATSKIRTDDDLFSISTLGFRGEALASISSVSHFILTTRDAASDSATQIDMKGGKITSVKSVPASVGTAIIVKDLFYNVPARRKFLKAVSTEMAHITDTLQSLALAHPTVFFRLTHNGREIKTWSATSKKAADRVLEVLGSAVQDRLYEFHAHKESIKVSGWLVSSRYPKPSGKSIYIFVNGRYIRDRSILSAIMQGYQGRLMKGEFPQVILFLEVPPHEVDVNVHPTKQEVRFANQRDVYTIVHEVISQTLQQREAPLWGNAPVSSMDTSDVDRSTPIFGLRENTPRISETPAFSPRKPLSPSASVSYGSSIKPPSPIAPTAPSFTKPSYTTEATDQSTLWKAPRFASLEIIGQFHNTYILCETPDSRLILIDQHAAHERITFERLKKMRQEQTIEVQRLLMPETLDLRFAQADMLERNVSVFKEIGFDIEAFGGTTFLVKEIPSLLAGKEIAPVLVELLEKTDVDMQPQAIADKMDHYLHTIACHASIRAHQKLRTDEIKKLLEEMDEYDLSGNCPHGRPTWIEHTVADIEKAFRRT